MADNRMHPDAESVERNLIRALETAPQFKIPDGFAARVAATLPSRPAPLAHARTHYGVRVALGCLVALAVLMLAAAPRLEANSLLWLSVESLFCAQFGLLTVWLVTRRTRSLGSF